jgi:hypothetical protein
MIRYNDWGKHIRLGNFLFLYAGIQSIIKDSGNVISLPNYFLWKYLKERPSVTTDTNYEELFYFKSSSYSKELKHEYKQYFINNRDKKVNINLGSYLQTEKWFIEDIDYIKSKLAIRKEEIIKVRNKYSSFFNKPTIGIGIRRGDFVNHGVFYQIPEIWYKKALIEEFPKYKNMNVVVFSDDIEWCKNYYKDENFLFAEANNTHTHKDSFKHYHNDPMEQFILASQMDNFIGGSSTFSWWNMWYVKNFNNGQVVHCGKNLSQKGEKEFGVNGDYYPENWKLNKI